MNPNTNKPVTHAPRVVSTARTPAATVDVFGNDIRVAALIAEYAPIAAAKAAKDRAALKLKNGVNRAK